ncbi:MAG: hypothetical protein AAF549_09495 [Pseudomonadota bacterium]
MNIQSFILTGQDYNPVYFGKLLWGEADVDFGDSEVGLNRQFLSLSNLYFLIPALFHKWGLPLESMSFIHTILGFPTLIFLYYFVSYSIFRSQKVALFSLGIFMLADFSMFLANIGYPLLFQKSYYYGDFNHIFVLLCFIFLYKDRIILAAASAFLLTLFNPTYGVNLCLLVGLILILKGILFKREGVFSSLIMIFGAISALVMMYFATPNNEPISNEVRELAIQSYYHIAPHIYNMKHYVFAQVFIISGLILSCFVTAKDKGMLRILPIAASMLYVISIVAYWVLYIVEPEIFILFAPSKSLMILSMFVSLFYGFAVYNILFKLKSFFPSIILVLATLFLLSMASGIVIQQVIWAAALISAFLFIVIKIFKPSFISASYNPIFCYITVSFLFFLSFTQVYWLKNPTYFDIPDALLDVSLQIESNINESAYFFAFKPISEGGDKQPVYSFRYLPLRTYSNKNMVSFAIGRNSYFDSQTRHNLETKNYKILGISLWDDALVQAKEYRSSMPLYYYLGYREGNLSRSAVGNIVINKVNMMNDIVRDMDTDQYENYARAIGATHIILMHMPDFSIDENKRILGNKYFSVIPL